MQNARENPLAAAAAAAAVSGAPPPSQANNENLLDIDFDGAAPASVQKSGMSGLEGLAGTPERGPSPSTDDISVHPSASGTNNLDDLMGLSNGFTTQSNGNQDVLAGFADLDLSAASQPPPPKQQLAGQTTGKKTNEDLLALF